MEHRAETNAARWKLLALAGPAFLAAVVGFWSITVPSLWRDESVTAHFARAPLNESWREWSEYDAVHAAYYLLVRLTIWIDPVELGLRLPSVVAFVAATIGIVLIGRRLSGWLVGACSATFYVLLPVSSRYAQEGRSYELVAAVAVFATLTLLRLVERPTWGRSAGYGALVAVLGCLHLYGLLLLVAHCAYILVSRRSVALRVFIAWAGAALVLLPLVLVASGQRERQLSWIRSPGWTELTDLVELFGGTGALTLLLGLVVLAGVWYGRRTPLPLMWATLPVLASFAISQVHPVFADRYVLFVVPALALLAGTGIVGVAREIGREREVIVAALVVGAIGTGMVLGLPAQREQRGPSERPDDLRSMTRYLAASAEPGDVLLPVPSNFLPFVNAYGRPFDRVEISTIDTIATQVDRVWAVNRHDPRGHGYVELGQLSRQFELAEVQSFGVVHLSLWGRR